jgi:hypothetical protein
MSVSELVNQVSCLDGDMRSTDGVEVGSCAVNRGRHDGRHRDVGVELNIPV